ncbi:MAG: hydrolase [Acidobacteriota bacterium]|nr:hydrolase [Blastocatellia bacterium]MDW8413043.1 hydrolase [Acidobacteriota bacterium]
MTQLGLLDRKRTILLVIDLQARLLEVMHAKDELVKNVNKLIAGAKVLGLPLLVSEQYPRGLGHTYQEIQLPDGTEVFEKLCFSCFLSEQMNERIRQLQPRSLILAGIESHICVFKTALDAISQGYEVHIAADAVSSRKPYDKEIALQRLRLVGAYIATVEMLLFQLIDAAGNDEFRALSKIII